MLIAGCAPDLQRELGVPILVTLQGDDIFLDDLLEPYKAQAFELMRELDSSIAGYLTYSHFYADYMAEYLSIPPEKIELVPLGIDTHEFADGVEAADELHQRPPTVGYLARLVPEKGLHVMVDAFLELRQLPEMDQARLRIAGWYGAKYKPYVEEQQRKIDNAGLTDAVEILGTVDRPEKVQFLREIDVLSTPSLYRDPKGLYVLEALAAGVPVVQPNHGAFPEMLAALGGGHLVEPENPTALAAKLHELLLNRVELRKLGLAGRRAVLDRHHAAAMAEGTLAVYRKFLA
jgi:glycosyltransferase involved in cell wall biosynthesis